MVEDLTREMRLDDLPREWLVVALAIAVAYLLLQAARRWMRDRRMHQRFARGAEGEREAEGLLALHGFIIEGVQVTGSYALIVDGRPITITVRADYIVRDAREDAEDGNWFVVEVKTGRVAPRIETAATRRQLLEYGHAFGVMRILLVDADAQSIRVVELPSTNNVVTLPWRQAS